MPRFNQILIRFCYIVLIAFFASILIRLTVMQVFVKHLGIENSFTEFVLWEQDDPESNSSSDEEVDDSEEIVWSDLYPFAGNEITEDTSSVVLESIENIFTSFKSKIESMEDAVTAYCTDYLVGYDNMVTSMNRAENLIGWNISPYTEYNGIFELEDG